MTLSRNESHDFLKKPPHDSWVALGDRSKVRLSTWEAFPSYCLAWTRTTRNFGISSGGVFLLGRLNSFDQTSITKTYC